MKTLCIINGVTGAIGSAVLSQCIRQTDTVVYGLSRQAQQFKEFCDSNNKMPLKTLVTNIGDITNKNHINDFMNSISLEKFDRLLYVHAVGIYPFEINENGEYTVSCDEDNDGIDDRVNRLSYLSFKYMNETLLKFNNPFSSIIFGGIADKYQPRAHISWWKTMNNIISWAKRFTQQNNNASINLLNISSVFCPHELITRPYVFIQTDADYYYWLTPYEVAEKALLMLNKIDNHFTSSDLFHPSNYYHKNYFKDDDFSNRKVHELYR